MLGMPSRMGYAMPSSSLISSLVLASYLEEDEDNSSTALYISIMKSHFPPLFDVCYIKTEVIIFPMIPEYNN